MCLLANEGEVDTGDGQSSTKIYMFLHLLCVFENDRQRARWSEGECKPDSVYVYGGETEGV